MSHTHERIVMSLSKLFCFYKYGWPCLYLQAGMGIAANNILTDLIEFRGLSWRLVFEPPN